MRQLHKEYQLIMKVLRDNDVKYRRLFPKGLLFTGDGKTRKCDNIAKDRNFLERNADKLGYQPISEESNSESEEESQ